MTFKPFAIVVTGPIEIVCVGAIVSGWSSRQCILLTENYFESSWKFGISRIQMSTATSLAI